MSREIKESNVYWIGGIPKQWKLVPTKRVLRGTKSIVGSEVDNYERLALTMNGVIKRNKEDNEGLQPEKFDNYQILRENELVFKLIDLQNEKTSRVGLSPFTGIVSPAYIVLTNEQSDNRFYYYWFFDMYNRLVFNQMSDDGVRANLNVKDLVNIPIPLISLSEQKAIADFLDKKCAEIDEMIALQEKIVEELKAYKQSVITEAVTKGLNPDVPMKDSGIEWIGEIPEHWQIGRMKNVCCQNGESLSEKENEDFEFDYVDIGSVSFEKGIFHTEHYAFKDAPSRARRRAKYGDFIMSTVRTYLRAIDVIDSEEKASYIYSTGFAVLTPNTNISYRFLSYISKSQPFLEQVMLFSRGINYPSINSTDLMCIRITYPSIAEQTIIAEYLDRKCSEIDSLITIKLSKIDSLKEYKKSIIYEYVTGKKETI